MACRATFHAHAAAPGAELPCPACGTLIVVGDLAVERRRRRRHLAAPERPGRTRLIVVVLACCAAAQIATVLWAAWDLFGPGWGG